MATENFRKQNPLILIADDDEEIVEVLSTLLEHRGFRVLRAMSGYDALGLILGAHRGEVDAVLSDLHMPHGSGLNLLDALRKMEQSLPVFLMTGDPSFDSAIALKAGASGVILKPLDTAALVNSLHSALGHAEEDLTRRP